MREESMPAKFGPPDAEGSERSRFIVVTARKS